MLSTDKATIGEQSFILRTYALSEASALLEAIQSVIAESPLRQMTTSRGYKMKAQMTNCGHTGWVSDQRGYRYQTQDPFTNREWPQMPPLFHQLGQRAAQECGFENFIPDVCLINCYYPKAGMGLHQDKDEKDFSHPIVSVSLGTPAVFQFGGQKRSDKTDTYLLKHGDVVVWGGRDRLRYHGVSPLKLAHHPQTGQCRFNLTLRKAL